MKKLEDGSRHGGPEQEGVGRVVRGMYVAVPRVTMPDEDTSWTKKKRKMWNFASPDILYILYDHQV